jgi:outer membrane protein assembly factor BamB
VLITPSARLALVVSVVALVATGCSVVATPSPGEDFSAFVATDRTCPARGDITGTPGEVVWTVDIGSESWSTPVVVGSTAYFGANDGVLRAMDVDSGDLRWTFETDGAIRSEVLAVDDGLYVSSDDGNFYALTLDGDLLWTAEIGSGDRADYFFNYGSRAESAGSILIVASGDGVVHAVERETGAERWTFDTLGPVQTNIAIGEGLAFVSSDYGTVYALDLATGKKEWARGTGPAATTHPAYSNGVVVAGSRSTELLGLDAADGTILWKQKYGSSWIQSGATVVGATVITGSSDIGEVRARDLASGSPLWATVIGGWAWGTPVECEGTVYTTSMRPARIQPWDVAVHALAATDGSLLWEAGTGAGIEWEPDGLAMYGAAASPAVAPNTILVPGLDGVVYGFRR